MKHHAGWVFFFPDYPIPPSIKTTHARKISVESVMLRVDLKLAEFFSVSLSFSTQQSRQMVPHLEPGSFLRFLRSLKDVFPFHCHHVLLCGRVLGLSSLLKAKLINNNIGCSRSATWINCYIILHNDFVGPIEIGIIFFENRLYCRQC